MKFLDYLKNNIVYLDGGMGTLLQKCGLKPGEYPERWNITHPDVICGIHKDYFDAGSNVVCTNTFGANSLKFTEDELEEIIKTAISNAKSAREKSSKKAEKFIALDIGPSGKLLKPLGDLDFEDAVETFAKTVRLGVKYGVDLIIIETMNDSYETKAALLAAKENSELPVIVSNAYGEDGKLMTGTTPSAMVAMLEGMGADAIGANCSLGPKQLRGVVEELLDNTSVPVILKPNAGLPKSVDGNTVYDITPDEFSDEVTELIKKGVRVAGGCCGTTPEYIKLLTDKMYGFLPVPIEAKDITVVSSYTHAVKFGDAPILIGERINPTGKKRFKQALLENDIDYILSEGVNQQEKGVHILDVNVGLPDIDEAEMLKNAVCELQAIIDLPLQIDTSDVSAMEAALRRYNGKTMINSVSGKTSSMAAIFPLVKKYGGVVVALTLDENGIPETVDGRVAIAKKILKTATEHGIDKKDIIFDTLAMTISADTNSAMTTIAAINRIKTELGCHTSLGVSNVSFGLPNRDAVNGVFFALALENGLSAAIMNPYSADMMKTYYSYKALKGLDENCTEYISTADTFTAIANTIEVSTNKTSEEFKSELQRAIIKGFKEKAGEITKELLKTVAPLDIVNDEIIPALNIVGKGFENKTVYLPQLLMSAEAAKSAFENIKAILPVNEEKSVGKGVFIIATVHGDIHDIGKNIVKLLLENYGFDVVDLGKDVPPEKIVETVVKLHAPLVGLSALMTTTVPAMEETIKQLKEKATWCRTVVGGAVLTQEYADKIGADKYAKDAMETVRYAETVIR
ncbi:MAG: homocysteine S-methyltransferase family protein [Clostridia bacterium]|nr:homocysteine S-methyltransferase family protein [Clostridia bacterium]MBQ5318102.1 homocysteine S-methyltransferase family protein [Oscillospiraceae bacterium]